MTSKRKFAICLIAVIGLTATWPAYLLYSEISKMNSIDPLVWSDEIEAFDRATAANLEADNALLFVGSSSIRFWQSLKADMAPMPVIQRGFGGARMADVEYYAERLISANMPAAVVAFVGTNDIQPHTDTPAQVLLENWQRIVERIRSKQPEVPIYYIAITPSRLRWDQWPRSQAVNKLIEAWINTQDNHHYINANDVLFDENDIPNPDYYRIDRLHLNEKGYAVWSAVIRQRLIDDGYLSLANVN